MFVTHKRKIRCLSKSDNDYVTQAQVVIKIQFEGKNGISF